MRVETRVLRVLFLLGELGSQTNPIGNPWAPSTWERGGGKRGESAGGWGFDTGAPTSTPVHNDNTVESVLLAVASQACDMLDLCM